MISVVVPLYNKEQSILKTLNSVLAQTYTDYEVLIVDDGSTDNSLGVVRQFIQSGVPSAERIRLIHQENAGVSAARNRGIIEAKGEYIAFLDADDLWASNYLETLAALIHDYPQSGLYCIGFREVNTDIVPAQDISEATYRGEVHDPWTGKYRLWTGSSCSNKERLVNIGLFDTRMTHGEDLDMWWRLILDGGLAVDTSCCAFYRQDAENRVSKTVIPLETHIPYYMDKYNDARAANAAFRRYFDEQMVYRLYPYLFDRRYRKDARRLARKIDYNQLKWTMRFRILCPHIYQLKYILTGC